ncbi:TPA: MFS transporter [Serratia fonticola]|uniref:Nucleoside transporter yegT n=1 Tax=Serratia fonticola TaxID=47917 RepID=A0A3S4WUP5_SERFO|nr:MFS transporter [Serratia fonticola]CAI0782235.1 Putative nucleoside transporter yegT [Serratia fonticola]CAI0783533.1 Putative nucleoside transporter yegT [Serratia fonticola]CAI1515089.1 Putative nucleoside transporter yegT [Serratia fonticola]CAI1612447.1 Putative nucleoside transporter yegT [Serratia fonticola]CAI1731301.1 Putative nucleoside transporter yegT [Serratia fonticola]
MDFNKTPRLLIMMFVQYFMQGAWNMTMGLVLSTYGMSAIIGSSYALLGLATILSPLFIGMVADRFFASQKVMAILHLINAGVILCVPQFIEAQDTTMTLVMIFLVGLLFYPTTALANSISFSHINGVKYFPVIRVFGTFGFMAIGFIIGQMGYSGDTMTWYIASAAGVGLGLYCFTLPDTPPKAKGSTFTLRDLLCLDALSLFKDRNFSILMLSIFVLMIPKTAYSAYIPVFLKALGFDNAASMMQVGIACEVVFMFLLSFFLLKAGFKVTLMMGAVCWIIRSVLFSQAALDANMTFVLIGLMLQGFCWDFFFTVGDIYVDRKARPEIKAQAQSLRFIVSNGFGLLFASTICGQIFNNTVTEQGPQALPQWESFWLFSAIIAAVVSVFFFIFFKDDLSKQKTPAAMKPAKQ